MQWRRVSLSPIDQYAGGKCRGFRAFLVVLRRSVEGDDRPDPDPVVKAQLGGGDLARPPSNWTNWRDIDVVPAGASGRTQHRRRVIRSTTPPASAAILDLAILRSPPHSYLCSASVAFPATRSTQKCAAGVMHDGGGIIKARAPTKAVGTEAWGSGRHPHD